MSLETDWQACEYAQDIHYHLRTKEQRRLLFRAQSPQLLARGELVEWLSLIAEKLEFCRNVRHLAIYLLDTFMDHHDIMESHLRLVSLCCLTLACKLEERDNLIPPISQLNTLVGNKYRPVEFYRMEVTILKFFQWDILFPTASHFLEYYVIFALDPDICDGTMACLTSYDSVKLYLQKYIDYFLEVSLKDVAFLKFSPSLVAASLILASRLCLGLQPPWPESLQGTTFYKQADLKQCTSILLRAINTEVLSKKFTQIYAISYATQNSAASSASS